MIVQVIALALFALSLIIISSEKINRSIVALVGAAIVILIGIVTQERAIESIDFNTLGLLIGMMIIVSISSKTGFFEYLAIKVIRATKGNPMKTMVSLALLTAVLSAFLDNVTTILLIAPVTMFVAQILQLSPIPFIISQVLFSNIGGTATLVGDPPNIIIGSAAGLSYMDFILNTAPIVVVLLIVMTPLLMWFFRKDLVGNKVDMEQINKLDPRKALKDPVLIAKCAFVFALTMVGFFTHSIFHLEAATIAMAGAALLLLLTVEHPDDIYKEIEWNTIFFFSGLFILVSSLEEVGIIELVAEKMIAVTGGNEMITSMIILWFSGLASGVVDNIPITTVMVTLIQDIASTGMDPNALWWSLSLGACLGGNMTLIGASANIVGADIAHKSNHPISFLMFLKYGAITSIISFVIASVYVYARYFMFA